MRALFVHISSLLLPAAAVLACGAPEGPRSSAPTATVQPVARAAPSPAIARSEAPDAGTCAARCSGRLVQPLVEAIALRAQQAHRCYDDALATDKTLRGKVMVRMTIGADGQVCEVTADGEKSMEAVAACVAGSYRATERAFPPPDNGCVKVNLPINFLPRSDDAGAP